MIERLLDMISGLRVIRDEVAGMTDTGFIDLVAARTSVRRLKLRRALRQAEKSIADILNALDKELQPNCDAPPAAGHSGIDQIVGVDDGRLDDLAARRIMSNDVRQKELLEGSELILQFLNALLGELVHGTFSSIVSHDPEATAEIAPAHRLSERSK